MIIFELSGMFRRKKNEKKIFELRLKIVLIRSNGTFALHFRLDELQGALRLEPSSLESTQSQLCPTPEHATYTDIQTQTQKHNLKHSQTNCLLRLGQNTSFAASGFRTWVARREGHRLNHSATSTRPDALIRGTAPYPFRSRVADGSEEK